MVEPDSQQSADTAGTNFSLDRIYRDPYTLHTLNLIEVFKMKRLAAEGLSAYLDTLPVPESDGERAKLEKFLVDGDFDVEIDLSSRAGQLVWAAGLGHVFQSNPAGTIRHSPIWRLLTSHPQISTSLATAARFVDLGITNREATMDWGTPGSWFYFHHEKNHVNIDLFNALLLGFSESPAPGMAMLPHATGAMMHEVGHSQLSTRFSDGMLALKDRESELEEQKKELREKVKGRSPTDVETEEMKGLGKALRRVRKEFNLRHDIWNAVEDNCVNQYAVNQSSELPYDFGASLNVANVLLQGTGMRLKAKEDMPSAVTDQSGDQVREARKKFDDIKMAVVMSFYATNGLFDRHDMETWKRVGIDPDNVKITIEEDSKPVSAADYFLNGGQKSDFQRLVDLNIGPNGAAWQQPHLRDRQLLTSMFMRNVAVYADRRAQIIDEIWDKYVASYADILLDASEEEHQQRKKDKKDQSRDKNGEQQPGGGSAGEDQESQGGDQSDENDGDDSSPSQGTGESQGQGKSDGQPQSGSQGGGGSGGDPQEQDRQDDPSPSQDGGSGGGADEEDLEAAEEQGSDDDFDFDEDDDGELLPSSPQDKGQEGCKNQGCSADKDPEHEEDAPDAENAPKVEDLAEEAKKQEQQAKEAENNRNGQQNSGGGTPSDGGGDASGNSPHGGDGQGINVADLAAKADWKQWAREITKLEPLIRRVTKDLKYIRERQKHLERNISQKKREILPRGNNMQERLDMSAHLRLSVKRATGQRIEEPDLHRWRKDDVETETTSVELWLLTDGSGSMQGPLPVGGRAIDVAVQSMAVLFEAGHRADFDVFAGMWGDGQIRMIAKPDSNERDIGKKFQSIKDGINSGTKLSPSFHQAIQQGAKQYVGKDGRKKRFAGMTHFMILSDGDLEAGDVEPTIKMMKTLFQHGPDVSIDIAVLANKMEQKKMEEVVKRVKKEVPGAAIDLVRMTDANQVPLVLAKQLRRRFERSERNVRAVPDERKREAFTKVDRAILNAGL